MSNLLLKIFIIFHNWFVAFQYVIFQLFIGWVIIFLKLEFVYFFFSLASEPFYGGLIFPFYKAGQTLIVQETQLYTASSYEFFELHDSSFLSPNELIVIAFEWLYSEAGEAMEDFLFQPLDSSIFGTWPLAKTLEINRLEQYFLNSVVDFSGISNAGFLGKFMSFSSFYCESSRRARLARLITLAGVIKDFLFSVYILLPSFFVNGLGGGDNFVEGFLNRLSLWLKSISVLSSPIWTLGHT